MPAIDRLESSVPPPTTLPGAGPLQDTPRITFGLHHRTALTAGAIIANNAFDRAYFTHDQAGTKQVDVPLDGVLEPGDYWLQLRGEELPSPGAGQTAHTTGEESGEAASTALAPMPPPLQPPARKQSAPSEPRSASTEYKPYPIVPSFTDWQFPHNQVPVEWKTAHEPPGSSPRPTRPTSPLPVTSRSHCCITDLLMGTNRCHVIPSKQSDWFGMNGMREYVSGLTGNIDDEANIITLRADLHLLFDQRRFAIAPKPSAAVLDPDSAATSSVSSVDGRYALTVHVLNDDEGTDEFSGLYHNVAIQPKAVEKLAREFVFARFAWSLFPLLQGFLETPVPRRLAVISKTYENGVWLSRVSDLAHPQTEWMNYDQYLRHLHQRGESHSGSRKRRSSQMSQNEEAADDECEERWSRRSKSMDSAHARTLLLTPDQRLLQANTEWYEQHCRYAAITFSPHDFEDEFYSKRGRSRTRESRQANNHGDLSSEAESDTSDEALPNLSRSFTTCGSTRSSVLIDPDEDLWAGHDKGGLEETRQGVRVDADE